jgi:hypothetical protein
MATKAYWDDLMKTFEEMPDEEFARLVDEVCADPVVSFALEESEPMYLTSRLENSSTYHPEYTEAGNLSLTDDHDYPTDDLLDVEYAA